jgi:hypothetical protein
LAEFTGTQAVTGHIAFVKMEQLRFHDLNEAGAMQSGLQEVGAPG